MAEQTLTVTEALRNFSGYVSRVACRNETFVLRKGNKPVVELRPVPFGRRLGDLPAMLRSIPRLNNEEAYAFSRDIDATHASFSAEK